MRRWTIVSAALALTAGLAGGAEAGFTEKPAAAPDRDAATVTFAVSAPTDVEVAILDGQGQVVRHLAAGMVGLDRAAPPLQPKRLKQTLAWDYTDDLGRPVTGAAFTARVRIGMRVAFGRSVGDSPYVVDTIQGIATDGGGRLYLLSQSYGGNGPRYIQVFDRTGAYLRTIMPYSNTLPREVLGPFGLVETGDDALTPRNHEGVWPQIYPLKNLVLQPRVSENGHLVFCDADEVLRIDTTGAAVDGFKGVPLWPADKPRFRNNQAGPLFAALTADGKKLYLAGPYVDPARADAAMLAAWPKGRVYVLDLEQGGGARPFVTVDTTRDRDLEVVASAETLRRAPHGPVHDLATDRAGNVYVCDRANDRVAIFNAEGKPVGAIPCRQPHLVAVHPTSGEVYVITMRPLGYRHYETRLLRFDSWQAEKPTAEMDLPREAGRPTLALDTSVKPAVIWLSNVRGSEVWRVEAGEGAFQVTGRLGVSRHAGIWGTDRIAVDYQTDDLYINDGWSGMLKYDGLTGEGGALIDSAALRQVWERDTNQRTNLSATDATVGPDGFVYLRNGPQYSGPITRWTRDLKPAPFAATGTHVLRRYIYSRYGSGYGERGLAVHPDGRVFVMSMYNWNQYFIHVFGPDGAPLNSGRLAGQLKAYTGLDADIQSGLIGPLTAACGGLKVDAAGNVYAGMRLFPDGFQAPRGFEADPAYQRLTGTVFKFTPQGGGVVRGSGADGIKAGGNFVEGAVQAYPDFAPFSGGFGSGCVCRSPRFDLDPFGRLYIPNALRYAVAVVDNAGNEILRFGRYGNRDDQGHGETIPLGWPIAVGVSQKHVYVSDMLNRRVVRVDVAYTASATAAVPDRTASDVRTALVESLVKMGPKGIAQAEETFAQSTADRDLVRLAVARIRADQVRAEALPLSVALDQPWLTRALVLALTRQEGLPTAADARVNLLLLTRVVAGWPAREAQALARKFLADADPRVRLAALWALDRDDMDQTTVSLAKPVLADKDERVRTLAAILLFDRGHADGLAVILKGPLSQNQWVLDLSRPAATEQVIVSGGPRYLKYPVGEKEVDLAIQLLNHEYNNMRWVGAGILMLSGHPRAPKVLADRLGSEEISFIRKRIILGLKTLRARAGVAPLLQDVATGPGSRKKGTGWDAAEAVADIGDPEMIPSLIAMLDQPQSKDLALFALSRAFDGQVTAASEYRLIPDAQGALARVALRDLPPPAEQKSAWTAFWAARKGDYQWNAEKHPLRPEGARPDDHGQEDGE